MVAVVILSLSFTLPCGEEPIPSAVSDVGPGLREAWEEMCALDLDRALVREMMDGIDQGNQRTGDVQELIKSCKKDGVDIIAFLQQMVQNQVLPKGGDHLRSIRHRQLQTCQVRRVAFTPY